MYIYIYICDFLVLLTRLLHACIRLCGTLCKAQTNRRKTKYKNSNKQQTHSKQTDRKQIQKIQETANKQYRDLQNEWESHRRSSSSKLEQISR